MFLDRPIGTWLLFIPCLWGLAIAGGIVALALTPVTPAGVPIVASAAVVLVR